MELNSKKYHLMLSVNGQVGVANVANLANMSSMCLVQCSTQPLGFVQPLDPSFTSTLPSLFSAE